MSPNYYTKERRHWFLIALIAVVLCAMALRIMPVISVYGESDETIHDLLIRADGAHYHGLAMQMIDNGFFGFYDKSKANNKEGRREDVVAFRVPLYPIFIRTIYAVFDVKPLVVVVFHVFFDTCIVLLICLWTQKLTDSYLTSLAAGMLYALNPAVILMNSSLFAETMFTAVFTATSLGFLWCLQGKQYWKYIVAGFLIGITTLVKPIEVLFMPALLIMILFSFKKGKKCFSKSVRYALLFSIAFFLTIAPWQARNLWIHGSYSLTYQQGFDLLLHRATWVKTIVEKKNAGVARDELNASLQQIKNPFKKAKLQQKIALEYMFSHMKTFMYMHRAGVYQFFFPYYKSACVPSSDATGLPLYALDHFHVTEIMRQWLCIGAARFIAIQNFLILLGISFVWRSQRYRVLLFYFVLAALYFSNAWGIMGGDMRARISLMPLIAIMASISARELWNVRLSYFHDIRNKKASKHVHSSGQLSRKTV